MVVAALGLAEYDPAKKYELKAEKNYIELIESATSPQGQPIQKVTVFNRTEAAPPAPQVIAYVLRDAKGTVICQANVRRVQWSARRIPSGRKRSSSPGRARRSR